MTGIEDGHLLRADRLGRGDLELDTDGIPLAPPLLFQFGELTSVPEEHREFEGCHGESVFWEEHEACPRTYEDVLRRINDSGAAKQRAVWKLASAEVVEPLEHNDDKFALTVRHWRDELSDAHAHIILAEGFDGLSRRKHRERRQFVRDVLNNLSTLVHWEE